MDKASLSSLSRVSPLALAVPLLSGLGMGISGYLTYIHLFALQPYCGEFSECEVVNSSIYAEIVGIPVALFGFLAYTVLLVLGIVGLRHRSSFRSAILPAILGVSAVAALYSAYLTYVELDVLNAVCLWCVSSAITISLILLTSIAMMVRRNQM